jgi:hypothetical protein
MSDFTYIHSEDVRNKIIERFAMIISGEGLTIPRVAVKIAVQDVVDWTREMEEVEYDGI